MKTRGRRGERFGYVAKGVATEGWTKAFFNGSQVRLESFHEGQPFFMPPAPWPAVRVRAGFTALHGSRRHRVGDRTERTRFDARDFRHHFIGGE